MESKSDPAAREDELVDALLDEALSAYQGLLPPELMRELRGCLEDRLHAHPEGRSLLRRAMPDPVVDESGDVATGEEAAEDDAAEGGTR